MCIILLYNMMCITMYLCTCIFQATLRAVRVSMSLLRGLRSLKLASNGSTSSNGSMEGDTCPEVFDDSNKT